MILLRVRVLHGDKAVSMMSHTLGVIYWPCKVIIILISFPVGLAMMWWRVRVLHGDKALGMMSHTLGVIYWPCKVIIILISFPVGLAMMWWRVRVLHGDKALGMMSHTLGVIYCCCYDLVEGEGITWGQSREHDEPHFGSHLLAM